MNKQVFALAVSAAASATFAASADAQTSVTLYGVIDEGINYTNNVGRGHVYELSSGFAQGSRWGLKGSEDLGGGTRLSSSWKTDSTSTQASSGREAGCSDVRPTSA